MSIESSILASKCDSATIQSVLGKLLVKESYSSAELLPVIKYVIPIYSSLNKETQDVLRQICARHFTFIPQILEYAKELGSRPEKNLYYSFLLSVITLNGECLYNYLQLLSRKEFAFLKSVIFGSKLFNALCESVSIVDYLDCMKMQWAYILHNTQYYSKDHLDLFLSCVKMHSSLGIDILVEGLVLSDVENWSKFKAMLSVGSFIHQRGIFLYYLVPYFNKVSTIENSSAVFSIISGLPFDIPVDSVCVNWDNFDFKTIYVKSLSESARQSLFQQILPIFEEIDISIDQEVAEMLVLILNNLSDDSKRHISHDPISLNFVTKRLHSEDRLVRERTMFVAKQVTNNEIKYDSDFKIDIADLRISSPYVLTLPIVSSSSRISKRPRDQELVSKVQALSFEDSDDESDEEPQRDILFIKDLLLEFENAEKNDWSPLKLLKDTVKLIRQKKDFPTEVGFYSVSLLTNISALSNTFDEKGFEEWKVNAIVSILVICPEKIIDLYHILFSNELSIQQRMIILTAASLSARELRGLQDDIVIKPKYDFPTERLPWDKPIKQQPLANKIQDVTDIVSEQTVWRSRKLDTITTTKKENRFRKHATQFFYPLAHAWLNGIDLGSFDRLFKKHYIDVLRMVLTCSTPHYELDSMKSLMYQIIEDAVKHGIPID